MFNPSRAVGEEDSRSQELILAWREKELIFFFPLDFSGKIKLPNKAKTIKT